MTRVALAVMIVVAAACGRRDAERDRMQKQIDELSAEVGRLKQEAAHQQAQQQPAEAPVPEPPSTGPSIPACRDYVAAVEAYVECDRVPQASREATRNAMAQMRASWRPDLPEDARAAAASACATATEAIRKGAAAVGCTPHPERGP